MAKSKVKQIYSNLVLMYEWRGKPAGTKVSCVPEMARALVADGTAIHEVSEKTVKRKAPNKPARNKQVKSAPKKKTTKKASRKRK